MTPICTAMPFFVAILIRVNYVLGSGHMSELGELIQCIISLVHPCSL
jgi:hypothetical protein